MKIDVYRSRFVLGPAYPNVKHGVASVFFFVCTRDIRDLIKP